MGRPSPATSSSASTQADRGPQEREKAELMTAQATELMLQLRLTHPGSSTRHPGSLAPDAIKDRLRAVKLSQLLMSSNMADII
jgi:hypothetical protein